MEKYKLGKTGLLVSRIALGCWGFAGGEMWGDQDEADSIATVLAALDAGINFFENAQGYGNGYSEELLGKALEGQRHRAVIATKIRGVDLNVAGIREGCERSLKRLRTDYIDLLQPHWPDRITPVDETMEGFIRLREEGKIRAFGLSNYGVKDLGEILRHGEIATNQLPYSLLFRAIEYEIQPLCVENDIKILCYSTLLHGVLTGKFARPDDLPDGRARTRHFSKNRSQTRHGEEGCEAEVFQALDGIRQISAEIQQPMSLVTVAWALHRPAVAAAIVGARKPQQIQQIAAAAELELGVETIQKLAEVTEPVKQILGPNADMWMSESRFR